MIAKRKHGGLCVACGKPIELDPISGLRNHHCKEHEREQNNHDEALCDEPLTFGDRLDIGFALLHLTDEEDEL